MTPSHGPVESSSMDVWLAPVEGVCLGMGNLMLLREPVCAHRVSDDSGGPRLAL